MRQSRRKRYSRDAPKLRAESCCAWLPPRQKPALKVTNQRGALDRLVRERNEMALLAERMAGEISQQGDEGLADRAALAPDVVDHRMVGGSAAIGPLDSVAGEQGKVLALQQDAGRISGQRFVVSRLETVRAGRTDEVR